MNRRDRRRDARRKAQAQQPTPSTSQQLAALYAAALGMLLAGLRNDGTVEAESNRIIAAGPKVAGPVLGLMTAAAANFYEHEHGGRDNAIAFVEQELSAVLSQIPDSNT